MNLCKCLFSLFLVLFLSSSAFAGNPNGTLVYGPTSAIPTLSGTMLIILSLLLAVVAFRVGGLKKNSGGSINLVIALGIGATLSVSSGVHIISNAYANNISTIQLSTPEGGQVSIPNGDVNHYENTSGIGQNIFQINPSTQCANIDSLAIQGNQRCVVGSFARNSQCYVDCRPTIIVTSISGGNPTSVFTYILDDNGRLSTEIWDINGDGTSNFIAKNTYDSFDNPVSRTEDGVNDFVVDGIIDYTRIVTYDASGNLLTGSAILPDGTTVGSETRTYDASGNLLTLTLYGPDGSVSRNTTYTYDSNDNLTSSERDRDGDGTPDTSSTYTYDLAGNQVSLSGDFDANGVIDHLSYSTYDAAGNRLSLRIDNGADGSINQISTWTYDAAGNQLTYSRDDTNDGSIDRITTTTYNADGNVLTVSTDSNADGTPEIFQTNIYNALGQLIESNFDNDSDGNTDISTRRDYFGFTGTF